MGSCRSVRVYPLFLLQLTTNDAHKAPPPIAGSAHPLLPLLPPRLPSHLPVPPAGANTSSHPPSMPPPTATRVRTRLQLRHPRRPQPPAPENVHALDKAAFIPPLHECVFDMSVGACAGMLESIMGDVRESGELAEREKARARVAGVVEREQEMGKTRETALGLNSPPGSLGRRTHKKRKSLQSSLQQAFLSIVA